uniref:Multiple C2 and transmembrane domain-containing protein 1 n=1 Tax=Cacopsylla melanoneura TaxID=428564 RepID=A0A8D8VRC3_9HEMI
MSPAKRLAMAGSAMETRQDSWGVYLLCSNFCCLELTVLLYLLSYKNLLNPTRDATNALPLKSRILKVLRLGCVLCCSTFNFSVPFISHLAIILLILISILLYYVSVRYLAIAWGINKFLRKILRPHTVPNNELLDLLSRVPVLFFASWHRVSFLINNLLVPEAKICAP